MRSLLAAGLLYCAPLLAESRTATLAKYCVQQVPRSGIAYERLPAAGDYLAKKIECRAYYRSAEGGYMEMTSVVMLKDGEPDYHAKENLFTLMVNSHGKDVKFTDAGLDGLLDSFVLSFGAEDIAVDLDENTRGDFEVPFRAALRFLESFYEYGRGEAVYAKRLPRENYRAALE